MNWSYQLTRIAGTDVKVDVSFLLLLLLAGLNMGLSGVIFLILLFGCVLLHEFGHIFAARAFGIRTPEVTLSIIGGAAKLERIPKKPIQEIIVALAGPAVNVVIAAVLFGMIGASTVFGGMTNPGSSLLVQLGVINVILIVFNLLPAFPMDGGRVLRAVLAMRMDYVRATDTAATVGKGMAILFGIFGLFYNPWMIMIAVAVFFMAGQEAAVVRLQHQGFGATGWPASGFRDRPTTSTQDGRVPVIDDDGNVVGWVDENESRRPRPRIFVQRF